MMASLFIQFGNSSFKNIHLLTLNLFMSYINFPHSFIVRLFIYLFISTFYLYISLHCLRASAILPPFCLCSHHRLFPLAICILSPSTLQLSALYIYIFFFSFQQFFTYIDEGSYEAETSGFIL